jgi:hypothetical protein
MGIVVDHQGSAWTHMLIESTNGVLWARRVLDHPQAENNVELTPRERKHGGVRLCDSMPVGLWEVLPVSVDSITQVDRSHERPSVEEYLGKTTGAATTL